MNWNQLDTVLEVVNKLKATNSNKDKLAILKSYIGHEDEKMICKVLNYTYDTFKKYGISEQVYDGVNVVSNSIFSDPIEMFDKLSSSNINDLLRLSTKSYIENQVSSEYRELIKGILFKDLKIGVNAKSINKVWKGLVPEFNVQLAESYSKLKPGALDNKEVWVTTKLDGFRIIYDPTLKKFFTRAGQNYEGIDHLISECDKLSEELSRQIGGHGAMVMLDGELLHKPMDGLNSQELYSLTSSAARKKGYHKDKLNLQFNVFDFIPVPEFRTNTTTLKYKTRRNAMNVAFSLNKFENLVLVKTLYNGMFSEESLMCLLEEVESQGGEGLMINLNGKYECKRTKQLLKVKTFNSADVLVVGVYEGEKGKEFEGTLGGVTIQFLYNGEVRTCNCGSGFNKDERDLFFNNPELIIGKIIEINYFEVSKDSKTGIESLRFGTYQHRIREDKTIDDITDVALQ